MTIGKYCIIDKSVHIGSGTKIMNFVELRAETHVGRDCFIDSYVVSSGQSIIEDGVTLRYGVIIARGCRVGQCSYLAPRVMTNNVDHTGKEIGGAKIGCDVFIGTHAVIAAGITIGDGVVIGSQAFVNRSIDEGVWVGIPARRIR